MTGILGRLASGRLMAGALVVVLVSQIVVIAGLPDRLASEFGYAGSLQMFALD